MVNGTAAKPVMFTSGLTTKAAGDWGGLVTVQYQPYNWWYRNLSTEAAI
jgi:hypothetical protein